MDDRVRTPGCSFCGKSQNEVLKLVVGPGVFISNDFDDLCNEVLSKDAEYRRKKQLVRPDMP